MMTQVGSMIRSDFIRCNKIAISQDAGRVTRMSIP